IHSTTAPRRWPSWRRTARRWAPPSRTCPLCSRRPGRRRRTARRPPPSAPRRSASSAAGSTITRRTRPCWRRHWCRRRPTRCRRPATPAEGRAAAVGGLGRRRDGRVPELLLRGWKGYAPGLRTQVLEVLSRRDEWLRAALDAAENKEIPAAEIDAVRRQRLLDHKD